MNSDNVSSSDDDEGDDLIDNDDTKTPLKSVRRLRGQLGVLREENTLSQRKVSFFIS